MTKKERIAERLKRLRTLANLGKNAWEREAAQRLFEKLVRKYDFDLADIEDSEKVDKRGFRFRGAEEEKLLLQVAAKVLKSKTISTYRQQYGSGTIPGSLFIECTKGQETEISFLFDFYKELWKEEKKKMLSAFIQKHSIAPDPGPDGGKILSPEELSELLRRMSALSDAEPVKRLEAENERN